MTVFNYDLFRETFTVLKPVNPCYVLSWGDFFYDGFRTISEVKYKELCDSKMGIRVLDKKDCMEVKEFSCRLIMIPVGQLGRAIDINSNRNDLSMWQLTKYPLLVGSRILIEDIRVNGERVIDAIVLRID